MNMFFDIMQAIFWSTTYILIIIFNKKYKHTAMPFFALCNNFAWESVAFFRDITHFSMNYGFLIHIAWFTLDLIIVYTYLRYCEKMYFKKSYIMVCYIISLIVFSLSFRYLGSGMLITSFIIDFTMALEYFLFSSKKAFYANKLSVVICLTKLIGDLCAWISYMDSSVFVLIIGLPILVLNILCSINIIKRSFSSKALK